MFILSSITSRLEFWSVNHTSIYQNIYIFCEISNKWPNDLLGANSHKIVPIIVVNNITLN